MKYNNSMLEIIGNTPLLKLNKVAKDVEANVFVKLEYLNPSGSYKDRMALSMIEAAEKGLTWNGKKLDPGGIVCDASAGNTAPALAFVCAVKGYRARFCTYKTMLVGDSARLKITDSFGPEVYMCPLPSQEILEKYCVDEVERRYSYIIAGKNHMYEMERDNPEVIWVDQIYNIYNAEGQRKMGQEIIEQLDGKIDAWGCSIGSGGCILGVTMELIDQGLNPWIFGVTPQHSQITGGDISADISKVKSGKPPIMEKFVKLMGLKKWQTEKSLVERFHEMSYPNEYFQVSSEDAREIANRLCREEGIYCGMSSGANVYAALKVAERMKEGQNVVTVIVDRRDRYLGEYPNDIYVV
jgi:cysteine synthase